MHWYGFSLVWILIWHARLLLSEKLFWQYSQRNGFSLVWVLIWVLSVLICAKLFGQNIQGYCFFWVPLRSKSWCTNWWLWMGDISWYSPLNELSHSKWRKSRTRLTWLLRRVSSKCITHNWHLHVLLAILRYFNLCLCLCRCSLSKVCRYIPQKMHLKGVSDGAMIVKAFFRTELQYLHIFTASCNANGSISEKNREKLQHYLSDLE